MDYQLGDEIILTVTKVANKPKESFMTSFFIVVPDVLFTGVKLLLFYAFAKTMGWM